MPKFARNTTEYYLLIGNSLSVMENSFQYNANDVVRYLNKPTAEFTKADIVRFICENGIRMINFLYPAGDGRLKTLNFVITDMDYLDTILTCGERVDGSSLFKSVQASSSDLYVLPRFSTAFVDPFAEIPTLALLCGFFDAEGNPLASGPEQTLKKAAAAFTKTTGFEFEAMGELEYYVIMPETDAFPATDQRNYHESDPFAKTNTFRVKCMDAIARAGGQIKYGHSEVGNFRLNGFIYEQNEIEFLPDNVIDAADQLVVAKWIIRNMAFQEGYNVTFAPKITTGKAGSGLHIHMRLVQNGKNLMLENGELSDNAKKAIAGMMDLAPSLTAFGNKNPTSYFRLVPHQEAPTNICWGLRNRSALVRVPLGWAKDVDMSHKANPQQPMEHYDTSMKQTVEIRNGDGSADLYQLLAGLCVACRHGFEMPNALEVAEKTFVAVNIHDPKNAAVLEKINSLPDSCVASADCLERQRKVYEEQGIFSAAMIDGIIKELRDYNDKTLRADIENNPEAQLELVQRFFHCG